MTHIPVQLPFKGFTEQSQFSAIPQGMTPSCLNMMPSDVWNGRMRISTRNGTQLYSLGSVQFMSTFRAYIGGTLVEKLISVRNGVIYYSDPNADLTATATAFPGQGTPLLNTTGFVEGVQFNEYFYFVDGTNYTKVLLTDTTTGVTIWGATTGTHKGPYHTDPASSPAGNRATLICRWGARVVLAGYKKTPNVWFACAPDKVAATGASDDGWSGGDFIGAMSGIGGTVSTAYGTLGDPIVAIFPFAQTGLMFGCTNSFSFLTTDPIFEEQVAMVSLTKSIGIAGQRAYCQSQEKGAFILANDGLYFINANDFNFNRANRVSAGRLDSFFLRIDFGTPAIGGTSSFSGGTLRSLNTEDGSATGADTKVQTSEGGLSSESTTEPLGIGTATASLAGSIATGDVFPCLCYDPDREGVWMLLAVSGVEGASLHLYYDLKTDSFWPQRFSDPNTYAPTSGCYVGSSRTKSGRLFLGGSQSISIIDRAFPIGVDGWDSEMGDDAQRAQFVRSSLTVGPVIGQLPYRVMLNEIRVDLGDDEYEVPSGFNDLSQSPIISVTKGDTAQTALGLQTDSLFVINLNPLVIDGGNAAGSGSVLYDGGTRATPSPSEIDGRFAIRPFGQYTQNDPFAAGINRFYNGPGNWVIRWDTLAPSGARWVIERDSTPAVDGAATGVTAGSPPQLVEYEQITADIGSPDGAMITIQQIPVSPDERDNADVSGASFPEAEVTEVGTLVPGRNTAKKCRIRGEAMYMTIASDGKPWSIERMSVIVSQVGKSRGD